MPTPKLTRRSAILGTAAAGAAAAVPMPSAAGAPSPEFVACQRANQAYLAACEAGADDDQTYPLGWAETRAMEALVEKISAKAVTTPQDVHELAVVLATSCYEPGEICLDTWMGETSCGIEHAIVAAAVRMGGVHA